MTPHVITQTHVLRVFNHPDDRDVRNFFEADLFADWVRRAKEVLRHLLADDRDGWTTDAIHIVEVAAGDERERKRLEIVRRNDRDVGTQSLAFTRRVPFDHDAVPVETPGER